MTQTLPDVQTPRPMWLGHPRLVFNLFGLELWERFSFYGMQSILAIYLYFAVTDGGVGLAQTSALSIVGAYGGSVFFCTVIAAWLADRIFGVERILLAGAVLMLLGQVVLALVPGVLGVTIGLVAMALGSGGVKATATAIVGELYTATDPRRDAGYSIFYAGITLGSLLGPLLSGIIQSTVGFRLAFAVAAIGMAIGIATYLAGRKDVPRTAMSVKNPLPRRRYGLVAGLVVAGLTLIALLIGTGVVTAENLSLAIVIAVSIVAAAYFVVIISSKKVTSEERRRVVAFIPLFLSAAVYFGIAYQLFSTIIVFANAELDMVVGGFNVPLGWVAGGEALFAVALGGLFATLWTKWGPRQPSTPTKFVVGLLFLAASFVMLIPFAASEPKSTSILILIPFSILQAIASLLVYPIGLSATTKLAPPAFSTQMVGLFYLAVSIGTALAGTLARVYVPGDGVAFFTVMTAVSAGTALVLAALTPLVLKLMGGIR